MTQGPVSNPEQPNVNRARALRPQTLGCRPQVVGDGPTSAVNVDGDIFSVVVRLDLRTDVPLIYLVAQAGGLFPRPARGMVVSLPWAGTIVSASPFKACFRTWGILAPAGVCDYERRSVIRACLTIVRSEDKWEK